MSDHPATIAKGLDALDLCQCGDYRRDHDGPDGRGKCRLCNGSPRFPWDECDGFMLSPTTPNKGDPA